MMLEDWIGSPRRPLNPGMTRALSPRTRSRLERNLPCHRIVRRRPASPGSHDAGGLDRKSEGAAEPRKDRGAQSKDAKPAGTNPAVPQNSAAPASKPREP